MTTKSSEVSVMKLNKMRLSVIAAVAALVAAFILISSVMAQTAAKPTAPYTVEANSMDLYPGWNLISVTPPMVGKSLFDMHNLTDGKTKFPYACAIDTAWLYRGDRVDLGWQFVKPNAAIYPDFVIKVSSFSANDVALGLWVNVVQPGGCRFGCGITGCLLG